MLTSALGEGAIFLLDSSDLLALPAFTSDSSAGVVFPTLGPEVQLRSGRAPVLATPESPGRGVRLTPLHTAGAVGCSCCFG